MNWLKYKWIYFTISTTMIVVGIYGLIVFGLKVGVDFRGGSIIEYRIHGLSSKDDLLTGLSKENIDITAIQSTGADTYLFKLPPIGDEERIKIASAAAEMVDGIEELRFETVGPSIGPELVRKTAVAIFISATVILLWVAYQFKNLKYGASAIIAMLHDSFILIGSFSILGKLYGAEVDFLFVTALLTTLSFSVHDTIVVFDRIREISRKDGGSLVDISNRALTETMVRSLNNSFTIMFMLVALLLLGGVTMRWFAMALLIGTLLGTYSSPFVAVPLLVSWDNIARMWRKFTVFRR